MADNIGRASLHLKPVVLAVPIVAMLGCLVGHMMRLREACAVGGQQQCCAAVTASLGHACVQDRLGASPAAAATQRRCFAAAALPSISRDQQYRSGPNQHCSLFQLSVVTLLGAVQPRWYDPQSCMPGRGFQAPGFQ